MRCSSGPQIKVRAGKLVDSKPIASCFLPQVVRVAVASQQHYGVSMTRGVTDPSQQPKPTPQAQWPPGAADEIAPLDKAIAADPKDPSALVARAAVFEKHKLLVNALADYKTIGDQWKDAVWVKGKIFELSESIADSTAAAAAAATTAGGKVYALLIGVSKYQRLPQEQWLQFADSDATLFEKHVLSPRGGGLPPENVLKLTDEKATTAALRNAFQTFLKGRATKKDTVLILIAGHGTVETPGSKGAYILTHDSDPQDLAGTAMPMAEVQKLVDEELSKVGRVAVFVDVCRSGNIGSIKSTTVNAVVEKLGEAEGEIMGIMASRPKELSYEGDQWGGGHGVFSYFLLKALEGAADKNNDGKVDVNELINYVQAEVPKATNDKQHPREFGNMDNAVALSDTTKPGINMAVLHYPMLYVSGGEPAYLAQAQPVASSLAPLLGPFNDALDKGRLLPDSQDSAFAALTALKTKLTPEQYRIQENRLRVALEDRGQQVILRYLTGDQVPQTQKDFQSGGEYYKAAKLLTPESLFLEGQESFMQGRSLLFAKDYKQAADLLEGSRAHRSWWRTRIQRAGHRLSGAGGLHARDSRISRCRAPRAALDVSAAQPGALLYGDRRFHFGDSHLSAGDPADAAVFVSALQSRVDLSEAEPAQGRRDLLPPRNLYRAQSGRAVQRAGIVKGIHRKQARCGAVLQAGIGEESEPARRAAQSGVCCSKAKSSGYRKRSTCGARI